MPIRVLGVMPDHLTVSWQVTELQTKVRVLEADNKALQGNINQLNEKLQHVNMHSTVVGGGCWNRRLGRPSPDQPRVGLLLPG